MTERIVRKIVLAKKRLKYYCNLLFFLNKNVFNSKNGVFVLLRMRDDLFYGKECPTWVRRQFMTPYITF